MGLLGAIGGAIKSAVNAVADVVETVTDTVTDVAKGVAGVASDIISDTFEIGNKLTGGLLGELSEFMGGSLGAMLNKGLDALGLPDWVGDVAGGVLDFCTGNFVGAAANGLDALEDLAKACGGDELAAFLKTGSDITNMFSPSGAASLGQIGEIANKASGIVDKLEVGMGALDKIQNGDLIGAGADIFNLAGIDAGEFAQSIGNSIDPELTDLVISCFGHAETAMRYLDDPVKGAQELLAGPLANYAPAAHSMFEGLKSLHQQVDSARQALPANAGTIFESIGKQISSLLGEELLQTAKARDVPGSLIQTLQNMLTNALEQSFQQLELCNENRAAFSEIAELLSQASARLEQIDLQSHHSMNIRA